MSEGGISAGWAVGGAVAVLGIGAGIAWYVSSQNGEAEERARQAKLEADLERERARQQQEFVRQQRAAFEAQQRSDYQQPAQQPQQGFDAGAFIGGIVKNIPDILNVATALFHF